MELSLKQGPGEINCRCQGCYPAKPLYYLGKGREGKEHSAEEEHWCDKQGEEVIKAVERWDNRAEEYVW